MFVRIVPIAVCLFLSAVSFGQLADRISLPAVEGGAEVVLTPSTGAYEVRYPSLGWTLSGSLGSAASHCSIKRGRDAVGTFAEIAFDWSAGAVMRGSIRDYRGGPRIWFRAQYGAATSKGVEFPKFESIPVGLNEFSYRDSTFAPPSFGLSKTATPWLLFDDRAHAMILSPASSFMVTTMSGDAKSGIGVAVGDRVSSIPAGFNQDSMLVFADGIGAAWDRWGAEMRALFHKTVPLNDSDPLLKKFGFWTDNGADYYYNYDKAKGYAGTLLGLADRYRDEHIPLGYLQLDSWWYQKSTFDPSGRRGGAKKNNSLPIGSWNRYGGLMEYRAHPDLFPSGLAAFQQAIGLPLAVHNRWIDRTSPYHEAYRISGVGAVDPKWWDDIAGYLKQSGVVCYEQDWLDEIYLNSPEMASQVGVGDAFTDGMANACKRDGLTMQYCMGTPRFFLQGLKYGNLTTIRTSGDRFEPRKWTDFLYVSRLAHDVGVWPWCDVFKSGETSNMILSVLSAGPVGTGDALGRENRTNILKAVRSDGVIVKPDQPLMPCDQTYIDSALRKQTPFVASTYTDHDGLRTQYVFAFARARGERSVTVSPRAFGITSDSYLVDLAGGGSRICRPDADVEITIGSGGYSYLMFAPVTKSGIALIGDLDKFVPTGKKRVSSVKQVSGGLKIAVEFAQGEKTVDVRVACNRLPQVNANAGSASIKRIDGEPTQFDVHVTPGENGKRAEFMLRNSM